MNLKQRKKFGEFIDKFVKAREYFIDLALKVFGGIGFILALFTASEVFGFKPILNYLSIAFGAFMAIASWWIILSFILKAIYLNKNNWKEKDNHKKKLNIIDFWNNRL